MKVSEIMQSSMVGDNTLICISKTIAIGDVTFKGHWYEDKIMSFADDEVTNLTYIKSENRVYMEVREVES